MNLFYYETVEAIINPTVAGIWIFKGSYTSTATATRTDETTGHLRFDYPFNPRPRQILTASEANESHFRSTARLKPTRILTSQHGKSKNAQEPRADLHVFRSGCSLHTKGRSARYAGRRSLLLPPASPTDADAATERSPRSGRPPTLRLVTSSPLDRSTRRWRRRGCRRKHGQSDQ